jgi:integrase/recombinase XerD
MEIHSKGDRIMGKLRDQMQADLQLRGITPGTQATYLREVRNLALYFKRSPEELGEKEIKEYLLYLINDKKLPEGTYRNYYSGLKFLYKYTLISIPLSGNGS